MGKIVGRQKIRASAALTDSYVAGTAVDIYSATTIVLNIGYTMGAGESLNAVVFKVEWSDDGGTTYYQDANYLFNADSITNGAITVDKTEYTYTADSAAATYDYIAVPIPVIGKKVRVSFKETGKETNFGTCECYIVILTEI